jgi:hypothetical protein
MTVRFDEVSATWRVVDDDGVVRADGFTAEVAAWRWAGAQSGGDLEVRRIASPT